MTNRQHELGYVVSVIADRFRLLGGITQLSRADLIRSRDDIAGLPETMRHQALVELVALAIKFQQEGGTVGLKGAAQLFAIAADAIGESATAAFEAAGLSRRRAAEFLGLPTGVLPHAKVDVSRTESLFSLLLDTNKR